jgi:hypothetical protein
VRETDWGWDTFDGVNQSANLRLCEYQQAIGTHAERCRINSHRSFTAAMDRNVLDSLFSLDKIDLPFRKDGSMRTINGVWVMDKILAHKMEPNGGMVHLVAKNPFFNEACHSPYAKDYPESVLNTREISYTIIHWEWQGSKVRLDLQRLDLGVVCRCIEIDENAEVMYISGTQEAENKKLADSLREKQDEESEVRKIRQRWGLMPED